MTEARVSQEVVETLAASDPNLRASQEVAEVLARSLPFLRSTQTVAEVLSRSSPFLRATQIAAEILSRSSPHARLSQIVIEVLLVNLRLPMLQVYPELPGLGFDVEWSPVAFNMETATTGTGADIDLALSDTPLHDFKLTYNLLRDQFLPGSTEWREMFGFVLSLNGTVGRFLFRNPDDCTIANQAQGTTDGVSSVFGPIVRTFGIGANSGTEPVGYVDVTKPFNLYLNGVKVNPSAYQIIQTTPCNQQIKFASTPAADLAMTTDMSYFYYCKLPDNVQKFNKFMHRLWALGSIKLHSCRPNA